MRIATAHDISINNNNIAVFTLHFFSPSASTCCNRSFRTDKSKREKNCNNIKIIIIILDPSYMRANRILLSPPLYHIICLRSLPNFSFAHLPSFWEYEYYIVHLLMNRARSHSIAIIRRIIFKCMGIGRIIELGDLFWKWPNQMVMILNEHMSI